MTEAAALVKQSPKGRLENRPDLTSVQGIQPLDVSDPAMAPAWAATPRGLAQVR